MKEKIIDHFKNDSNIVSIAENGDTLFITVKDKDSSIWKRSKLWKDVSSARLSRNKITIKTKEKTMADYKQISSNIVGLVGGKDNISYFTHCVTRLRFNLKDQSKVKKDEVKKLPGALGSQWQNGQLQVIIGQDVADAYKEICENNGLKMEKAVNENVDANPAQKGFKGVLDTFFDGISGSLTPLIPALIGCGMIKVILIFMDMAGVSADSGTYQLLTFAGDAGFYFLPIMVGAFAAKKFGMNMA